MPRADHRAWPPGWAVVASMVVSLAGLGVAAFLTYAHFADNDVLACPDTGTINCAKVTTSSQSEVFGVLPVAVLGLAFFAAMLGLCLPMAWHSRAALVHRLRLVGVVTGVGMVVYLIYAELFQIHAICLYCTVVHALTVLLFAVVVFAESDPGRLDERRVGRQGG